MVQQSSDCRGVTLLQKDAEEKDELQEDKAILANKIMIYTFTPLCIM